MCWTKLIVRVYLKLNRISESNDREWEVREYEINHVFDN